MAIDLLQDQQTDGGPFDPSRHLSRTTPDLEPIATGELPAALVDKYGRRKTYLRISVTDRCNMSCTYCVPHEGVPLFERDDLLTLDQLLRIGRIGASLGITKIRVTGGEPTIRPGLPQFIAGLATLPGIQQVAMTTNGLLLARHAQALADTGLHSLNLSIDSLDPARFARITRGADLGLVLGGLDAALEAGMEVKLNTVALADLDLQEASVLVDFAIAKGLEVRFIEFMPLCGTGWKQDAFRPLTGLKEALAARYPLEPLPSDGGVAQTFQVVGTGGKVGFIASLSANFCGACSRLRVTATGVLRPCLFSPIGVDLRPLLLSNRSDQELIQAFHQAVLNKPEGHGLKPEDHWAGGESVSAWIRTTGG
ncbi:MAG TPA: GTP 3',8-cyclase MoaA [bacterium]|nr:GTP 3',8-cyclase MoaA [bacterium]